MKTRKNVTKLRVAGAAQTREEGKKVDEVTRGSVTISIYRSDNKVKVPIPGQPGEFELKVYESYIIPFYEGRSRKTPRRSTLEKAKKLAAQIATRLSQDGARAEHLSEKDRRIYVLEQESARKLGMEVDEVCRAYATLKGALKAGTLPLAVSFYNDHGERVHHGVDNTIIYAAYLGHLAKRGAGDYHMRDKRRYVGPFIKAFPGPISPITTHQIDIYFEKLKGKARSKNNVRDAIMVTTILRMKKGICCKALRTPLHRQRNSATSATKSLPRSRRLSC